MDERKASPGGVERAVQSHLLAVDYELTLIWLHDARKNLDQRALAGAVLAKQPQHNTRHDQAVGTVECEHARIALDEAPGDDERLPPEAGGGGFCRVRAERGGGQTRCRGLC